MVPVEVRRRIVAAYQRGDTKTYAETAKVFGVGVATVNRLLRRVREGKDVRPDLSSCGRKVVVDKACGRRGVVASARDGTSACNAERANRRVGEAQRSSCCAGHDVERNETRWFHA